jgi:23S rRNA pseudouridine1911/1915/1917 synthase
MHAAMQRDAAAGRIRKEYLAVTEGIPEPPAGTIALPLARDPADRRRVVATPDGARSETRYELLSSIGGRSVVRCELVTGRTHQIRVHLSARGWPIVGDRAYGLADEGIARQALHAWRISLPHPRTAAPLAAQAPLPHDIAGLLGVHDEALSPDQRTQGGHQHQHDAEGDDNGGAGRQVED